MTDDSSSFSSSGEQNDDSRHSGSKGTNNTADDSNGTDAYSSNKKATKSIFSGFWSDGETTTEGGAAAAARGVVDYEGFNLTIGDVIYEIGVGDVVVMRSADEQNEINEQDNDDVNDDEEEEKDSRDQRRQRRLERDSNSNSNSNTKSGAAQLESSTPSDYAADAKSDKASDYYNADNNDIDVNATDGAGGDAVTAAPGNDETKNQSESSTTENKEPAAVASSSNNLTTTTSTATSMNMKDAKVGDGLMLARVERIWQEKGRGGRLGKILFQARWFLKKEDVDSLPLEEITGPISSEEFANRITEHDLVLSNQSDDNHVTTICGLIQVLYRHPDLDKAELPSLILPTTYLCRYSLSINQENEYDPPKVVVLPYTGENDDWGEMTVAALNFKKRDVEPENEGYDEIEGDEQNSRGGKRRRADTGSNTSSDDESESDELVYGGDKKRRRVGDFADEGIDEGSTEQRDIQVGRDHQVYVPPYIRNQKIVSRNPIRMWKPDKINQEGTDEYLEQASKILTPFLREHHLTQEEPYAPFPTERMEELSKSLSRNRLPTLSSVSTASSLTTRNVDTLREFNIDALLRNLHVSNYNVKAAIAAIEASPQDYLTVWSPQEKTVFNAAFRRYSGSLRAIYKGMGNKALQEVIDYHYRFKIPDQYRRVQERKREQAVRMLECIETKRNLDAPILITNSHSTGQQSGGADEEGDWTKTGNSTFAMSAEERRSKAKELILDVKKKMGSKKMLEVMKVIKKADETALGQTKAKLLEIFRGHKEFQSRFLEHLPQQLRL